MVDGVSRKRGGRKHDVPDLGLQVVEPVNTMPKDQARGFALIRMKAIVPTSPKDGIKASGSEEANCRPRKP